MHALTHMIRRNDDLFTRGLRQKLRFTGTLQKVHAHKGLRHRIAHGQQAVIAQNDARLIGDVGNQAVFFFAIKHDAFIGVIGHIMADREGRLAHRQQTIFQRGHRNALFGMGVDDAMGVFAGHVNGAVDGETGGVQHVVGVLKGVSVHVHLHEGRGCDLFKQQAKGIEQKMMLGPGNTHREMGKYQIIPTVMSRHAVSGGQLNPQFPLFFAHTVF